MAIASDLHLEARLLLQVGDQVLLVRPEGESWYVLPGGPVTPAWGAERTLDRYLGGLDLPAGRQFVGVVEHVQVPGTASGRGSAEDHGVTLLFAAQVSQLDADKLIAGGWREHAIVAVGTDVLLGTRLHPVPVARAVRRWVQDGWPRWLGMPSEAGYRRARPSVASLRAQLAARRAELTSLAFRDAAVAMCALVTLADGDIDPAEREGLRAFVASDPILARFPSAELEDMFDAHLARLQADFTAGKRAALTEIVKVRGRGDQARAVVAIGEVIGRLDGEYIASEWAVVREAIQALGLDQTEFPPPPGMPA
jgi:tellurite resistance protein